MEEKKFRTNTHYTWLRLRPFSSYGRVDSRKQIMDMSPITTLQYSHTLSTHSSSRYRIHGVPFTHSGRLSAAAVQFAADISPLLAGKRAPAMPRQPPSSGCRMSPPPPPATATASAASRVVNRCVDLGNRKQTCHRWSARWPPTAPNMSLREKQSGHGGKTQPAVRRVTTTSESKPN